MADKHYIENLPASVEGIKFQLQNHIIKVCQNANADARLLSSELGRIAAWVMQRANLSGIVAWTDVKGNITLTEAQKTDLINAWIEAESAITELILMKTLRGPFSQMGSDFVNKVTGANQTVVRSGDVLFIDAFSETDPAALRNITDRLGSYFGSRNIREYKIVEYKNKWYFLTDPADKSIILL